jgi:hypothetical protein
LYAISKKNLCKNIFNLIEKNLERYNNDKAITTKKLKTLDYWFFEPINEEKYFAIKKEIKNKIRGSKTDFIS